MRTPRYYGRWSESTGIYTSPDGKQYKMTFEEYVNMIEKVRGPYAAHTIRRKKMKRQLKSKENNE